MSYARVFRCGKCGELFKAEAAVDPHAKARRQALLEKKRKLEAEIRMKREQFAAKRRERQVEAELDELKRQMAQEDA